MRLIILPGDKFSNFTVIKEVEKSRLPSGQSNRMMLCRCSCGSEKIVRLLHLTRGRIKSCGCLSGYESHGKSKSLLYNVWRGVKNRCYCESYAEWHLYGGKGVAMCKEWLGSFIAFEKWAIENNWEHGLQLDRIDSNGNYEPENCRFVTPFENTCNMSTTMMVEYDGVIQSFRMLIESKGLSDHYYAIRTRYKRGWSAKRAIDTPIRKGNYVRGVGSRS